MKVKRPTSSLPPPPPKNTPPPPEPPPPEEEPDDEPRSFLIDATALGINLAAGEAKAIGYQFAKHHAAKEAAYQAERKKHRVRDFIIYTVALTIVILTGLGIIPADIITRIANLINPPTQEQTHATR